MASPVTAAPEPSAGPVPKGRRRWVRIVVVVVALAVLGALAAGGLWTSGIGRVTRLSPDDAPFAYPGRDTVGAPAPVGVPLSFGSLLLGNPTNEPITITGARVLEAEIGVTVLGVQFDASRERKASAVGVLAGFPAPNPGSQYQDAPITVEPVTVLPIGVDVVVGVQANRPGRWWARGIELSYRRGGRDYVTTYPNTFVVCTDMTVRCEIPPQMPDV